MCTKINDTNYIEQQEIAAVKKFLWVAAAMWVIMAALSGWINFTAGNLCGW